LPEQFCDFLGVLDRRAKYNGGLVFHIFAVGINNQLIPTREAYGRFKVLRIILKAADPNVPHVDIGSDPDASNRDKGIQLHGSFQVELVGDVLKYREKILAICSFRCSG
jgi:hypothetical protein